jgi:ATP-dependent Clp protease ATP-binding subunit ClpB
MPITTKYTPDVKQAIQIAQALAKEHRNETFGPAHLLHGILHNDIGLATLLASWGKDPFYLKEWAEIRIGQYPKSATAGPEPSGDEKINGIMEVADISRLKLGEEAITPLGILMAMCKPNVAFTPEQLKTFGLTEKEIIEATLNELAVHDALGTNGNTGKAPVAAGKASVKGTKALMRFCVDKTEMAANEEIDPIIGRESEVRMIAEILGRRTKPNVIVVGEPGVGKTALVDGFALNIAAGNVPTKLENAKIFELDTGSLVAGASYKGEVEDRLKSIMAEIKQFERAILFIDEIHVLLDPAGGAAGAANLLKPELARGRLTVIGATTTEEYREFIESDDAFRRRFEKLLVGEPDERTTVKMLETLLPYYEEHHGIDVDMKTLPEAVRLAKRYIKDRRLPDAAIDLMDRTMASIKMMGETSARDIEQLHTELTELQETFGEMPEEDQLMELQWFYTQLRSRLSPILLGQLDDETDVEGIKDTTTLIDYLTNTLSRLSELAKDEPEQVQDQDVAAVVAFMTGIPLGKIQAKEREKLLQMEEQLQKRVVGQDHALKTLSEAVRIARSGLGKPGLPIGSFFLSGPTGTGKTELAKSLAEFLFNDEKALIRFDMSEFKEEHSAALLYGAPPGYVGYKEGGLLVNKIRQQPYAVVLFDEIEKAHPSVFDIFLQILDEGKLSDKLGKVGDFSNSIVLFTSNIGSQHVEDSFAKGNVPKSDDLREIMGDYFRPEFLGRLTEIVPFGPISEEVIELIFRIQLKSLHKSLDQQGISMELEDALIHKLAMDGFTPQFGARPIRAVIRNSLQRPISEMLISGKLKPGQQINAGLDGNNEITWGIK